MSGLDLLKKIRVDSHSKNIPVLMVISEDLQGNIITAIKAGLNDYIVRPFEEHKFKQKLEKILLKWIKLHLKEKLSNRQKEVWDESHIKDYICFKNNVDKSYNTHREIN